MHKQQSSSDWHVDEKQNQQASNQSTNIFVQTAASKLIPPRKIGAIPGAIPGQHLPPFLASQKPFDTQGSHT
jgi:hypothetical protein